MKEATAGKSCEVCWCKAGQVKGERKPAVLTINHLFRNIYNDLDEYMKCSHGRTEITCTTCNWMFESGKDVCQVCLSDTVAKYKHFREPMCRACFHKAHPEIKELQKVKADAKKQLLKKLNDEQKAKYEQLKKDWFMGGTKPPVKLLTFKEWKAKKIADGTWEERNKDGWT